METSVISENSITDMNSRLYALGLPPCRPCEIKELISKIGNDAFNRSISTIHYDASSYRSIARGIVTVDIPRRNPLYTPLLNIEDKAKEEGMDLLEEAEKSPFAAASTGRVVDEFDQKILSTRRYDGPDGVIELLPAITFGAVPSVRITGGKPGQHRSTSNVVTLSPHDLLTMTEIGYQMNKTEIELYDIEYTFNSIEVGRLCESGFQISLYSGKNQEAKIILHHAEVSRLIEHLLCTVQEGYPGESLSTIREHLRNGHKERVGSDALVAW